MKNETETYIKPKQKKQYKDIKEDTECLVLSNKQKLLSVTLSTQYNQYNRHVD